MNDAKVRFAVVGLGHIAQAAVLPAFENAHSRCELVALVSSDAAKLKELSKAYAVERTGSYDALERTLREARVDAAYIALPNSQHRDYAERCARAGVHVLCEKPMAMTEEDCESMIRVCDDCDVKLMIAYRLHFDPANLRAIELAQSDQLGELRFFSSCFAQEVRPGDIRTKAELGGGALFDLGVYCVNAARGLFRAEPVEVYGVQSTGRDPRVQDVDEMTTAILRFPDDRVAQLTVSQNATKVDEYRLVGDKGSLLVEPSYTYVGELVHHLTFEGRTETTRFPKSDQFAPELLHLAECILRDTEPEPSGEEGLADVRVLAAIRESARSGRPVALPPRPRVGRPGFDLAKTRPPVSQSSLVHTQSPTK